MYGIIVFHICFGAKMALESKADRFTFVLIVPFFPRPYDKSECVDFFALSWGSVWDYVDVN